jgi:hypothetical protein
MARRTGRGRPTIDLGFLIEAALRVAGAIVLDACGFIVWNVGSRSPLAALAAARRATRSPRAFALGLLATLAGVVFIVSANVLLLPAVPSRGALAAMTALTVCAGLALELLIGNDVRRLAGKP